MKNVLHLLLEADDDKPATAATDYNENAPIEESETEVEEAEVDPDENGATDYNEDAPTDEGSTTNTEDEPISDESVDSTDETTVDNEKNGDLIDDFVNLYYSMQTSINKLSTLDKSNMNINKVVARVTSNLVRDRLEVYEYIKHTFSKIEYTGNLMKYNFFLEAYRINIAILRKTKVFIPISQNNNVKISGRKCTK